MLWSELFSKFTNSRGKEENFLPLKFPFPYNIPLSARALTGNGIVLLRSLSYIALFNFVIFFTIFLLDSFQTLNFGKVFLKCSRTMERTRKLISVKWFMAMVSSSLTKSRSNDIVVLTIQYISQKFDVITQLRLISTSNRMFWSAIND